LRIHAGRRGPTRRGAVLQEALAEAGYRVVARLRNEENLAVAVREYKPDMVIIDMEAPGRDTLEQMREVSRDNPQTHRAVFQQPRQRIHPPGGTGGRQRLRRRRTEPRSDTAHRRGRHGPLQRIPGAATRTRRHPRPARRPQAGGESQGPAHEAPRSQ
ncbi:hypothetical protein, partial [Plasmodium yoelii yoelii]